MPEQAAGRSTTLLSRSWEHHSGELSFVTRVVAGALTRRGPLFVLVPGPTGSVLADGAFDLVGVGQGPGGGWPRPDQAGWPDPGAPEVVVLDRADPEVMDLLARFAPTCRVMSIASEAAPKGVTALPFTRGPRGGRAGAIGLHVPVHPLAATHRHNGLGFTGYVLVLSDRAGVDVTPPTDLVAWLTARFPQQNVVVVEDGSAAAWRGRALRGTVPVDTRTDLWRLMAHARLTIDLAPGGIVARECVESLRYGTPIVVPAGSAAEPHAEGGGGFTFAGVGSLLASVEQLLDDDTRQQCSTEGRRYADERFGDPSSFVANLARSLDKAGAR
jgi:hypothetical protein